MPEFKFGGEENRNRVRCAISFVKPIWINVHLAVAPYNEKQVILSAFEPSLFSIQHFVIIKGERASS
jgi:hypothetical protein